MNADRFVRRPVEVEAMQVTAGNLSEIADWCGGVAGSKFGMTPSMLPADGRPGFRPAVIVPGARSATIGVWVVKRPGSTPGGFEYQTMSDERFHAEYMEAGA